MDERTIYGRWWSTDLTDMREIRDPGYIFAAEFDVRPCNPTWLADPRNYVDPDALEAP